MTGRYTYANTSTLMYRLRAAGSLLGVTDNTIRSYADNAGVAIQRASDLNPGVPSVRVFTPDSLFQIAQWRRNVGYLKGPSTDAGPAVIAVSVIKGGTGKTTTAVELGLHLQLQGLRVLLVDIDVQASATQMMGYEADLTLEEAGAHGLAAEAIVTDTLSSVLIPFIESQSRSGSILRPSTSGDLIKKPFGQSGPHLIPADTFLSDIEYALANAKGQRELFIRKMLMAAKDGNVPGLDTSPYDVVIFDCPPNVSFSSTAALAAADFVVAPIRLDAFSVKGLTKLMSEINGLDKEYRIRPELIILPTHYQPQLARIGRMQTQLNTYRDLLAPNVISASEEFPKSLDAYLPLTLQKPTSNSAKEYQMFAQHIYAKLMSRAQKGKKLSQSEVAA